MAKPVSPLRQKILDTTQKHQGRKELIIGEGENALRVEIRTPSLAASLSFANESSDPTEKFKSILRAVICCTYDPENGLQVFDETDVDLLMEQPAPDIQALLTPITEAISTLISSASSSAKN